MCEFLAAGGVRVFDDESRVPYAYKDYDWISYEDNASIYGKVGVLIVYILKFRGFLFLVDIPDLFRRFFFFF